MLCSCAYHVSHSDHQWDLCVVRACLPQNLEPSSEPDVVIKILSNKFLYVSVFSFTKLTNSVFVEFLKTVRCTFAILFVSSQRRWLIGTGRNKDCL